MLGGPELEESITAQAVQWIIGNNLNPKFEKLTMVVNNPGGNLSDAFAIVDAIASSFIPIQTVGIGLVGSAALMVFMSGRHRIVTPNVVLLSHQYSGMVEGKEHEVTAAAKDFKLTGDRVLKHYRKYTRLKDSVIRKKLLPAHDIWLSAEQAIEYGLADSIVENWIGELEKS
jgi:ATP-dependent Clp protease protease subunit